MAQDPNKPLDDGKIRLPRVDEGMNRIAPNDLNDKSKVRPLRAEYKSQQENDGEILARARKRLDNCIAAETDNRRDGLDDDKFYYGDQWSANDRARRNSERRPCLTFNKFPVLVKQVTGDQRQNRPNIDVHPVGNRADVDVARIYKGIVREIERDSHADIAYDTGFESAVRKGWGYWRIVTEYESPTTFDQVILIKRIRNAYSVYLDPLSSEIDGSDAKFGFITEMIDRDEFKAEWPDADPMHWTTGGFGDSFKNWIGESNIRIAEYYETKLETRELVLLGNGYEGWRDEIDPEIVQQYGITEKRKSIVPKITWYKLTGKQILERTEWPGRWLPIVKVIGDEQDIEGRVKLWGVIRQAKDAQRMYNYTRTNETERVMLVPKAPYLIAEGQIEGYESQWKEANNKSQPTLIYRAQELHGHMVPPPIKVPPVDVPAGIVNLANEVGQDMMATTGIRFFNAEPKDMRAESSRALRELRRSGDLGSFNYVDNLMHSLRHTGEILIDLIPKIYTRPGRVLTILREDNEEEQIELAPNSNKPLTETIDPQTQRIKRAFDPLYGTYGVTVTIGPSYATRRIETAEAMMDFLRAVPTAAPLISDLVAKNQDWEGSEEIAARLASTLPPGLNQPNLRDIPPQIRALLIQSQQQIQQLTQQRQQLLMQVADRNADRSLARERINRDFEAKLLGIVQKAQAEAQKVAAEDRRSEAQSMHNLASDVLSLYSDLSKADLSAQVQREVSANKLNEGNTGESNSNMPQGAKLAPDGNYYVSDPNRPGKYLRVVNNRPYNA